MQEIRPVLIVEDDEDIREAIRDALEEDGIRVTSCEDGAAALDAAKGICFRVVVTDYQMPGMTGVEVTRLLRARCPDSFIIGLSGEKREKDFLAAGADVFIRKPFSFEELISLIEQKANR